ncbi:MAG: preprotein translocase subunit YajC [Henriciella sp.]|nr:preprotein translocase subunit YajC [Henriciella sp.]
MRKLSFIALIALATTPSALASAPAGPAGGILGQLIFFVPLILIFYFLLIRPQSQRQKRHREMIEAIKKGDTVVTAGGLIGKVTKVAESEVTVELADGVRVRSVKAMLADVRDKNAPVPANDTASS